MKINKIVMIIIGLVTCFTLSNANASWIDWTSTNTGTILVNGITANVSMTHPASGVSLINGNTYYSGYPATYDNLNPSDLIQVSGTGTFTLTFDQALVDPYMAMVSVGQPNYGVTYSFNDPFTVVSSGPNQWGPGSYSVTGNDFTGNEFSGILQFSGSFTSISFTVN
ncbi:MAG: hypothetical protein R3240_13605, partial [Gammaproteobacteria bacterium]|nr:hypothetical protein [Gammaproteobacteria bacterium]